MKIVIHHFINGGFVPSHGQEVVDIHNPATGELIGRATLGDAENAERAIASANSVLSKNDYEYPPQRKACA